MSLIATVLRELMALGLEGEALAQAVERIEAQIPAPVTESDAAAERRRAWDRERKRRKSANSGGIPVDRVESASLPPETKVPPDPLKNSTPISPPSPPKGGSSPTIALLKPNGFARFWEAYPSKVGKRAAELAYDRALRRIAGPDPPRVILAGVESAKASRRWAEGFIPNPATWLNQDRWADEPETPVISLDHARRSDPPPSAKRLAHEANMAAAFRGAEIAIARRRGLGPDGDSL